MTAQRFGIFVETETLTFSGGAIAPLPQFDEVRQMVNRCTHPDGFVYPPIVSIEVTQENASQSKSRQSHLYRLPASHELRLDEDAPSNDRYRERATFIIQILAYLYGACVQFEDWWFDARVPVKSTHNIHFDRTTAEHFLSHAAQKWKQFGIQSRNRLTNILFMLNRAPSYEWDWEHFMIEYMITDACFSIAADLGKVSKKGGHSERIATLCTAFQLQQRPNLVKEIVRLRNELFHETLWDMGQPGTARSFNSFHAPWQLRRLNQRLILALLGYENEFMRSAWWALGAFQFKTP